MFRRGIFYQATNLVWIGFATAAAASTSISYGNFTIPAAGVVVVIPLTGTTAASTTVTGVTIGGIAATLHAAGSAAATANGGIASRRVAPGTYDITVTYGSGNSGTNTAVGVWLVPVGVRDLPAGTGVQRTTGTGTPSLSRPVPGRALVSGTVHANTEAHVVVGATAVRYEATQGSFRFNYSEQIDMIVPMSASWTTSAVYFWAAGQWR